MQYSPMSAWDQVNMTAKLADMKDQHYQMLLAFHSMLDILIDKGLISRDELERKAAALDAESEAAISSLLRPMG
ncbi:hypothetical protein [Paenibacillus sambharensis]|nr:hypothetical protein [Paenibacillus sambharensis]